MDILARYKDSGCRDHPSRSAASGLRELELRGLDTFVSSFTKAEKGRVMRFQGRVLIDPKGGLHTGYYVTHNAQLSSLHPS